MSPDKPFSDQDEDDPQSWNLYSYVRNNPLSFEDPTGTTCVHSAGPHGEQITEDNGDGKGCGEIQKPLTVVGTPPPIDFGRAMAALGHHGMSEWSKILESNASKFFREWSTGPLDDPTANYFDRLHRLYNPAVRNVVDKFLNSVGKERLEELTKEEVRELAKKIIDSEIPGVKDFLTRLDKLNPGRTSILRGLIDSIDFGSAFVFTVPGQNQMFNMQSCGARVCGGGQLQ